jgi:hypothetical protein
VEQIVQRPNISISVLIFEERQYFLEILQDHIRFRWQILACFARHHCKVGMLIDGRSPKASSFRYSTVSATLWSLLCMGSVLSDLGLQHATVLHPAHRFLGQNQEFIPYLQPSFEALKI